MRVPSFSEPRIVTASVLSSTAIELTWLRPHRPCQNNNWYLVHYVSKICGDDHSESHLGGSGEPFTDTVYNAEGLHEITDYQFTLTTINFRHGRNITVTTNAQTLRAGKLL